MTGFGFGHRDVLNCQWTLRNRGRCGEDSGFHEFILCALENVGTAALGCPGGLARHLSARAIPLVISLSIVHFVPSSHDANNSEARAEPRPADSRGRLSPHFRFSMSHGNSRARAPAPHRPGSAESQRKLLNITRSEVLVRARVMATCFPSGENAKVSTARGSISKCVI